MARMLKEKKRIDYGFKLIPDASPDEILNQDTLEAMNEVEDILSGKIDSKKYHSFNELREELNI